jgi:hypothetical protein
MWARHLLLPVVALVALAALRASLFPLDNKARQIAFDPGTTADDDFQQVVARVDESFRQDWAERGLTPAPQTADLAVARRLSLALTGTIPSLEEVRQFEAQPAGPRLAGWAGHLLRDRRFADYFADRLSRAYLGTEEGPLVIYRKRRFLAWLADQLRDNRPYGEVVRDMVAGSGLNTSAPAVNFIAAAYDDEKKATDAEKLAIRVSRAFLGLRLDCAQCHDHFLEPSWKQTDFQALAAFFGQTRQVVTHVHDGDGEYRFEDRVSGGTVGIDPVVPFLPDLLPADGTRREKLASWLTDRRNVHFARATVNRMWAMLFGRPLRPKVEAQTLDDPAPPALDILAEDFAAHGHDLRRLILLIASTEVFRLDSASPEEVTDDHEKAWAVFPLSRLRPEQVIGSVLQAASVRTIDRNSHVVTRSIRYFSERDFVTRYGDPEDDDFVPTPGTLPQRLLLMNGELVDEQARENLLNASARIALLAPTDEAAVESAYLTVLTRRPTEREQSHFAAQLSGRAGGDRQRKLADLFWVLFNATELSYNH